LVLVGSSGVPVARGGVLAHGGQTQLITGLRSVPRLRCNIGYRAPIQRQMLVASGRLRRLIQPGRQAP
jgi:hypothetical protein